MSRPHDIGGQPGGPLELAGHEAEPWQKLMTAFLTALRDPKYDVLTVDEIRRAIEDLGERYHELDYFERWAEATQNLFEEKGLMTRAEIAAKMAALRARREAGG